MREIVVPLGALLIHSLHERGLSVSEFAQSQRIDRKYLSRIVEGKIDFPEALLPLLEDISGVPITKFAEMEIHNFAEAKALMADLEAIKQFSERLELPKAKLFVSSANTSKGIDKYAIPISDKMRERLKDAFKYIINDIEQRLRQL